MTKLRSKKILGCGMIKILSENAICIESMKSENALRSAENVYKKIFNAFFEPQQPP